MMNYSGYNQHMNLASLRRMDWMTKRLKKELRNKRIQSTLKVVYFAAILIVAALTLSLLIIL